MTNRIVNNPADAHEVGDGHVEPRLGTAGEMLTERVRLRPLHDDDFDALYETVFSDPQVSWARTARSRADSRKSFDDKLAHVRNHGFGMMAVTDRETGTILGYAGLQHLADGPDVEVGYYLGRGSWGRGIATEVTRHLIEYGFGDLGLQRIVAVVRPDNAASRNVLAKSGLRQVGTGHHYGADVEIWATERLGDDPPEQSVVRPNRDVAPDRGGTMRWLGVARQVNGVIGCSSA